MDVQYSVVTGDVVAVSVTSSATSFASERRFGKELTIANLKVCAWACLFQNVALEAI